MTIREELKKLVAKLGGTPSKDDQTAELIHKVTDNVSGGGGGSSLIPITIDIHAQNPSIEADEVLAGLDDGIRYEVSVTDSGSVLNCGELRKCTSVGSDNVQAFAMGFILGTAGGDRSLSLMLVGIRDVYQGGEWVTTWYVNSTGCYLSIDLYD